MKLHKHISDRCFHYFHIIGNLIRMIYKYLQKDTVQQDISRIDYLHLKPGHLYTHDIQVIQKQEGYDTLGSLYLPLNNYGLRTDL